MIKNNKKRGSITLEAAIVVPMFVILMLTVNGIFVMLMGQQIMAHTLVQSAKSMAFDPYSTQRSASNVDDKLADMFKDIFVFATNWSNDAEYVSTDEWYDEEKYDQAKLAELARNRFVAYLGPTKAADLLEVIGVENGIDGLDFSGSTLEDGVLTIKIKYMQEFLLNVGGLASFEREISVKVNLFESKSI